MIQVVRHASFLRMAVRIWSIAGGAMLLSHTPLVGGEPTAAAVGKLRSEADAAFVGGDIDKSIKLMNQVTGILAMSDCNYER